jgi:hypothetical protein
MRLGSYLNIAHERDRVFAGFFLTVHWGTCPYPPDQPLMASMIPIGGGLFGSSSAIRDDGRTPTLVLCSESETMHNYPVRQPDTDTFRFWEMAGTAHASSDMRSELEGIFERDGLGSLLPRVAGENSVEATFVRDAALQRLVDWIETGNPPPSITAITVEPGTPAVIRRDEHGNALGGIRMPDVVAPTATNLGTNDGGNPFAQLSGSSIPFEARRLERLYGDLDGYAKAWDSAVDDLIALGLILPEAVESVRARGRALAAERFRSA